MGLPGSTGRVSGITLSLMRRLVLIGCALTVLGLSIAAQAVTEEPKPGDPGLRDPSTPDSIPNISGMWQVRGFDRYTKQVDGSDPPWQPWNKKAFEDREAAEAAGTPLYDPTAACLPSGTPRIISTPYPAEIIQTPDETVFLYEAQHLYRVVYMNQEHPKNIEPTFMGHAVGHWEGDTLVVDTVGLVGETQIDEGGTQHSDQMHVVERIRKIDDLTLEILFTIDDPKAFTKPWTARRLWSWRPEIRFLEYVCEENNRNAPDDSGVLRNY